MQKIRYLSLFSGIEAWTCAVKDMPEYEPVAFAEVDPFACAVLAKHYPNIPNLGDVTKIDWSKYNGLVDIIVGGSPCQGFSVAGYKKGLRDSRSNLALAYVQAIEQVQPKWILWENVVGVLSTNNGDDFRCFLSALDGCGYSCAWQILDSVHFGVPQRRRRIFVVGYSGDWTRAAKVFFEPNCMQRHPPACKKARKDGAGSTQECSGGCGGQGLGRRGPAEQPIKVSGTLCASGSGLDRPSAQGNQLDYCVVDTPPDTTAEPYTMLMGHTKSNGSNLQQGVAYTVDAAAPQAVAFIENE